MPWSGVDTKYRIHRVKHTPSPAYTEYSLHWVLDTLSTASAECCIQQVLNTRTTAYTVYCIIPRLAVSSSQPVFQLSADRIVLNSLSSHNSIFSNEYSLSVYRTRLPIYRFQIDWLQIDCLEIDCLQLDHLRINHLQINHHQVLLQFWLIMATKCITQFTWSRSPSTSPN